MCKYAIFSTSDGCCKTIVDTDYIKEGYNYGGSWIFVDSKDVAEKILKMAKDGVHNEDICDKLHRDGYKEEHDYKWIENDYGGYGHFEEGLYDYKYYIDMDNEALMTKEEFADSHVGWIACTDDSQEPVLLEDEIGHTKKEDWEYVKPIKLKLSELDGYDIWYDNNRLYITREIREHNNFLGNPTIAYDVCQEHYDESITNEENAKQYIKDNLNEIIHELKHE